MLDEEKLSGKLLILRTWLGAVQTGTYAMDKNMQRRMGTLLDQCLTEAEHLERAIDDPALLGTPVALFIAARDELELARRNVQQAQRALASTANLVALLDSNLKRASAAVITVPKGAKPSLKLITQTTEASA